MDTQTFAAPPPLGASVILGIYEKALRWTGEWSTFFAQVKSAGFSFVDLSVDESAPRSARLDWTWQQCQQVREAAHEQGVLIGGICLSVHRKIMPGSKDSQIRQQAVEVFRKGIDLCRNLGVPLLQVAGYYAYYEEPDPQAAARYLHTLATAVPYAAQQGVILGIENVDGNDINGVDDAAAVCQKFANPWLQIYPDVGNIAEHGGDAVAELRAGKGRMMAIHIKDVLPGQPRRIPIGQGVADFPRAFKELHDQGFCGRMMIEMWNDEAPDSVDKSVEARLKVEKLLAQAQISVIPPASATSAQSRTKLRR